MNTESWCRGLVELLKTLLLPWRPLLLQERSDPFAGLRRAQSAEPRCFANESTRCRVQYSSHRYTRLHESSSSLSSPTRRHESSKSEAIQRNCFTTKLDPIAHTMRQKDKTSRRGRGGKDKAARIQRPLTAPSPSSPNDRARPSRATQLERR